MKQKNIEIHVSDYCNRNCSFCTMRNVKSDAVMSLDTAKKVLDTYEPDAVTFSGGGEPTCNNRILTYLADGFVEKGAKVGLITNGYRTPFNEKPFEWVRLSVYSTNCEKEINNVLHCNAKTANAALFFKGMDDLKKYTFLKQYFDEVTVKTLNEQRALTDEEVEDIVSLGFKVKKNPERNDFARCIFDKPCIGVRGEVYKCCLCKADGGFFGVDKCTVPCVMYNSNKAGEYITNKYGFSI